MNDLFVMTLVLIALVASGLRSSIAAHWGVGLAAALIAAGIPWLGEDIVAAASEGRIAAWLATPTAGRTLGLILVAEALITGAAGLRSIHRAIAGSPPSRIGAIVAALPAPSLILGLCAAQVLLFNRSSDYSFQSLTGMLSGAAFVVVLGVRNAARWLGTADRRAEALVVLAAGLAAFGAFLPLLLRPPLARTMAAHFDRQATLFVPLAGLVLVGLGYVIHLGRTLTSRRSFH